MICAQHDWWDAAACPKCVTAAVTPPAAAEPETKIETDLVSVEGAPGANTLDIPDFLRRNKDGTFAHPELIGGRDVERKHNAESVVSGVVLPYEAWTDVDLYAALDGTELSLIDRQPIYQELRAREDKKKAHARIADMKAKKAAKET